MDHNTYRENLSAFLDGELPPLERAALEAHLAGCPDCRSELAQLGAVSKMVKTHGLEPVPPALKEAVLGERRPAARPWLKPVLALCTAAACVLVVLNLAKSPDESLSTAVFSARSGGEMRNIESAPAGEAGRAMPPEEPATAASPAPASGSGIFAESDKKAVPRFHVAAARGSYGQAKFASPRSLGAMSAGAGGAGTLSGITTMAGAVTKADAGANTSRMSASKPGSAAEFRGPVCVHVYNPGSLNEAGADMYTALAFLRKTGTKITAAEPGRLVFVKKDGARKTLTEKNCGYGFIFFDSVQDPLVVTDFIFITDRYNKYFGASLKPISDSIP